VTQPGEQWLGAPWNRAAATIAVEREAGQVVIRVDPETSIEMTPDAARAMAAALVEMATVPHCQVCGSEDRDGLRRSGRHLIQGRPEDMYLCIDHVACRARQLERRRGEVVESLLKTPIAEQAKATGTLPPGVVQTPPGEKMWTR
jgi:hypothetical protein